MPDVCFSDQWDEMKSPHLFVPSHDWFVFPSLPHSALFSITDCEFFVHLINITIILVHLSHYDRNLVRFGLTYPGTLVHNSYRWFVSLNKFLLFGVKTFLLTGWTFGSALFFVCWNHIAVSEAWPSRRTSDLFCLIALLTRNTVLKWPPICHNLTF